MLLSIVLLVALLSPATTTIPFDGIIHRASDASSFAFLAPPRAGNHASFIEELKPHGTLAVAWFTGGEGTPNCSIAVSLLQRGSRQFTAGVIVSERANYSNQNPVLYWDNETQILHLYHSSQRGNAGETNSQLWHAYSDDQGATWSSPEPFYTVAGAFDRNRIIPTVNNDGVIFPCYNSSSDTDYSFVLRWSLGVGWTRADMAGSDNFIQPTLVRLGHSPQLRAFYRDENNFAIYYADSEDDGLTWSSPKPSALPNNNAGIQAYTLQNGAIVMAFNNLNGTKHPRSPLTLALSYDQGITWPYKRDLQVHDDDNSTTVGEYSYPSVLQTEWSESDDNDIHVVYTYERETIKYVRVNERWIRQGH